jgi:hypothetical protein
MKFKLIQKLVCLSVFLLPAGVFAENIKVSDESAPILYEARAEIRIPDDKLAEYISADYRKARDEFTRNDLFQKIKPIIDSRLAEAKKTKTVLLLIGGRLADYDFDKNAFPTGFSASSFIPFKNDYAVTFTNGEKFEFLPVPFEFAKSLSSELSRNRRAKFIVYGEIVGAKEEKLRRRVKKVLQVRITKIEVSLRSGTEVGSKML